MLAGVKNRPVEYQNSAKAWMTSKLFNEWLQKLDKKMDKQNRDILMFVDNCPSHVITAHLKRVKVGFSP